jgi:hypothetical protein
MAHDFSYRFWARIYSYRGVFGEIDTILNESITIRQNNGRYFSEKIFSDEYLRKPAQDFIEHQRPEHKTPYAPGNDRVFPLETVTLQQFRREHNAEIEAANIHIGSFANELASTMNALAVVVAEEIYFRHGAYQPESEEGRKILAHELTHIAQYKDKRTVKNTPRETLEEEAENAEGRVEYAPDPYEPYVVDNQVYHLKRSQIARVTKMAADGVEKWIYHERFTRREEDYLKLLCAYEGWLKEGGY